jgi:uncharacterized protein (TIGR03382 family)
MLKYAVNIVPAAALVATLVVSPLARAGGGVIIDGAVAKSSGNSSSGPSSDQEKQRKNRDQEVYLYVASVLNSPIVYVEETGDTTPNPSGTMSSIIDDVGGEQAAGCAGAPSLLAALVGLVPLFRRRRR